MVQRGMNKRMFGKVKFFARRLWLGEGIPLFVSRKMNRAIDEHEERIRKVRTRKRRD